MIALSVTWRPEDQAWFQAAQARRGLPLGILGWSLLASGLLLALAVPLAWRLAEWAVVNLSDPAPLLWPIDRTDALLAGAVLGTALVLAILLDALNRFGLRTLLEQRAAEGREPLVGPIAITLGPDRATFRAETWDASYDTALVSGLEEAKNHLILYFGPARPVLLPRRDLTVEETAAVQNWAAGLLTRGGRVA